MLGSDILRTRPTVISVDFADGSLIQFPPTHIQLFSTAAVVANDMAYYANRTDAHGPAMTWSAFAMAYLFALGDEASAAPRSG